MKFAYMTTRWLLAFATLEAIVLPTYHERKHNV